MRSLRWATCLWPGLPQLWIEGSYSGLALAAGFALLVNLVLVATLGWTELLNTTLSSAAWSGMAVFWLVSAWLSLRWLNQAAPASLTAENDELYREAQSHYLRGSWFEAEVSLGRLLARQPRDADARLLLATLLRHTGRRDEATEQLRLLEKLDGAVKWQMEIRHERTLLADEAADDEPSSDGAPTLDLPWSENSPLAGAA